MKFLISVVDSASGTATPEELRAIDAFNDTLHADGHWVIAGGLAPPSEAVVVDGRGEEETVTPGPLHEGPEFLAGFWVVEAEDRETALRLAAAASWACNRRVEVRALR